MQPRVRSQPSLSTIRARVRAITTPVHPGGRLPTNPPAISAEQYAKARAAWLAHGTLPAVEEAAGIGRARALRLVDSGEPSLSLPSLRDCARAVAADLDKKTRAKEQAATTQTANEQAATLAATLEGRARAAEKARTHEVKVLGDAVESRADEVRLVRANRTSALVLARVNADLLKVSLELASSLLTDLPKLRQLDAHKRMGILRTVAGIVQRTAQASSASVQMERLLMGEPTHILGRADGSPSTSDMTVEEAEQWLTLANRAFERRASRRTLIDATPDGNPSRDDDAESELLEGVAEDLTP